jgi:hypothetical protein
MSRSSLRHGLAAIALLLLAPAIAAAQPGGAPADAWSDEPIPAPPPEASAPTASDAPAWTHDVGLLLEVSLDRARAVAAYDASTGGVRESPAPAGTLFAGYQGRRWSFGVGLELARTVDRFEDAFTTAEMTATTFGILPGLRVALGHASDGRAELLGIVDVGLGETRFSQSGSGVEDLVYQRFRLQFGPGLRYWVARSVAIGVSGLIRHDRMRNEVDDSFNGNTRVGETTHTDLVTSLNLAGVF